MHYSSTLMSRSKLYLVFSILMTVFLVSIGITIIAYLSISPASPNISAASYDAVAAKDINVTKNIPKDIPNTRKAAAVDISKHSHAISSQTAKSLGFSFIGVIVASIATKFIPKYMSTNTVSYLTPYNLPIAILGSAIFLVVCLGYAKQATAEHQASKKTFNLAGQISQIHKEHSNPKKLPRSNDQIKSMDLNKPEGSVDSEIRPPSSSAPSNPSNGHQKVPETPTEKPNSSTLGDSDRTTSLASDNNGTGVPQALSDNTTNMPPVTSYDEPSNGHISNALTTPGLKQIHLQASDGVAEERESGNKALMNPVQFPLEKPTSKSTISHPYVQWILLTGMILCVFFICNKLYDHPIHIPLSRLVTNIIPFLFKVNPTAHHNEKTKIASYRNFFHGETLIFLSTNSATNNLVVNVEMELSDLERDRLKEVNMFTQLKKKFDVEILFEPRRKILAISFDNIDPAKKHALLNFLSQERINVWQSIQEITVVHDLLFNFDKAEITSDDLENINYSEDYSGNLELQKLVKYVQKMLDVNSIIENEAQGKFFLENYKKAPKLLEQIKLSTGGLKTASNILSNTVETYKEIIGKENLSKDDGKNFINKLEKQYETLKSVIDLKSTLEYIEKYKEEIDLLNEKYDVLKETCAIETTNIDELHKLIKELEKGMASVDSNDMTIFTIIPTLKDILEKSGKDFTEDQFMSGVQERLKNSKFLEDADSVLKLLDQLNEITLERTEDDEISVNNYWYLLIPELKDLVSKSKELILGFKDNDKSWLFRLKNLFKLGKNRLPEDSTILLQGIAKKELEKTGLSDTVKSFIEKCILLLENQIWLQLLDKISLIHRLSKCLNSDFKVSINDPQE